MSVMAITKKLLELKLISMGDADLSEEVVQNAYIINLPTEINAFASLDLVIFLINDVGGFRFIYLFSTLQSRLIP